ncbi:hypothetical protein AB996_0067 [Lactococcus cremoris]|uniref:Uncharacterized protein n=1 Tax=Lactococcus lactis subsp. cremoris TaxID=1359 RepID=A0A161W5A2_LACLC|nr:hypothetical protein [Lactococcus cremoris]KZK08630.1 hypothetical protein AB996_0067 [Lactococcus cremoris]
MWNLYKKIIAFSSTQKNTSERINLIYKDFILKQIIDFTTKEEEKQEFLQIISEVENNGLISVEIDDNPVNKSSNLNDIDFDEADTTIILTYSIKNVSELIIIEKMNINRLITEIVNKLKIKDIRCINNQIDIFIYNSSEKFRIDLSTNWLAFKNDSRYYDKYPLILPDLVPTDLRKDFIQEIFRAFIDLIAERRIGDEFLVRLGNNKVIDLSVNLDIKVSEINEIYSIITYVFDDKYRYDDKIQILRKVLTDTLFDCDIDKIRWSKILQSLKDNYTLFIDKKLEVFLNLKITLITQVSELTQKIDKSISDKVEEISKQMLVFLATIVSSFIIKMPNNKYQLFLIMAAAVYIIILMVINSVKGIHFSSDSFKNSKKDIENIEQKISNLEIGSNNVVSDNNTEQFFSILNKLIIIERIQCVLYILIILVILMLFIIA